MIDQQNSERQDHLLQRMQEELDRFTWGRSWPKFRPSASFDKHLDAIRVVIRNCSTNEIRVSAALTLLEDNFPASAEHEFMGFTIKGLKFFSKWYWFLFWLPSAVTLLLKVAVHLFPQTTVDIAVWWSGINDR